MSESEARRAALKRQFQDDRGYWNPFWEGLLEVDPEFFAAYLQFSSVPWKSGSLSPKVRELIYIAIDASTTHLYEPGIRQHVQNALRHGATRAEIMEVYELTSVLGIHTCTMGVPVLLDELRQAGLSQKTRLTTSGAGTSKPASNASAATGTTSGTGSCNWIPTSSRPTWPSPLFPGPTGRSSPRSRN